MTLIAKFGIKTFVRCNGSLKSNFEEIRVKNFLINMVCLRLVVNVSLFTLVLHYSIGDSFLSPMYDFTEICIDKTNTISVLDIYMKNPYISKYFTYNITFLYLNEFSNN